MRLFIANGLAWNMPRAFVVAVAQVLPYSPSPQAGCSLRSLAVWPAMPRALGQLSKPWDPSPAWLFDPPVQRGEYGQKVYSVVLSLTGGECSFPTLK